MTKRLAYSLKNVFTLLAIAGVIIISSCTKNTGSDLIDTKVSSVIQINVNSAVYSIASVPDAISFSTDAVATNQPNLRQYLISGKSSRDTLNFTLGFHIDSVGSGDYVIDKSQLGVGSKTYISTGAKSTDRIVITKLDASNKLYTGTFSFYSFNQSSATDSVLVTGTYSIQQ
jgi:hypothetical protein